METYDYETSNCYQNFSTFQPKHETIIYNQTINYSYNYHNKNQPNFYSENTEQYYPQESYPMSYPQQPQYSQDYNTQQMHNNDFSNYNLPQMYNNYNSTQMYNNNYNSPGMYNNSLPHSNNYNFGEYYENSYTPYYSAYNDGCNQGIENSSVSTQNTLNAENHYFYNHDHYLHETNCDQQYNSVKTVGEKNHRCGMQVMHKNIGDSLNISEETLYHSDFETNFAAQQLPITTDCNKIS